MTYPIIQEIKVKRFIHPKEFWKIHVIAEQNDCIKYYQATFDRWHDLIFSLQRIDSAIKYNNAFVETTNSEIA